MYLMCIICLYIEQTQFDVRILLPSLVTTPSAVEHLLRQIVMTPQKRLEGPTEPEVLL